MLPHPCSRCPVRHATICSVLDEPALYDLARAACFVRHGRRATIVHEGAPASAVFNVVSGVAKLQRGTADGREQVVGFLYPGDFLGLAEGRTHPLGARAVTDVVLCTYPRATFEHMSWAYPTLDRAVLHTARRHLAAAHEQITLLGRGTARERLAHFLTRLIDRAARAGQPTDRLWLPMSYGDIADHLGLALETTCRTMTELRRDGLVGTPSEAMLPIHDVARLAAEAGMVQARCQPAPA